MSEGKFDVLTSKTDRRGKLRWTRVGVAWGNKSGIGFQVKLEALPLPNDEGETWLTVVPAREADAEGSRS